MQYFLATYIVDVVLDTLDDACINIIVDAVKQDVYNHVPVERVGRSLTPAQMDSSRLQQAKESVKRITFRDASGQCDIGVKQVLDSAYGCYIWPSALSLSNFVWHHREQFTNSTVLEIGAGVSLPSLLLAKTHHVRHVILSDLPSILPLIQSCFKLNDIDQALYDICELQWGDLEAAKRMIAMVEKQQKNRKIDYILGSDTFYDPADFEKLLMTISFILQHHNPECVFITAYQERSAKRSIQYLLDKWHLKCKTIPNSSVGEWSIVEDHQDEASVSTGALSSVFLLEISLQ